MKKPIIEIKNLSKKYKGFVALKNINLKIYEGEKIAIIGSNGAGKSTLVEIIAGIRTKTSGEIVYNLDEPKKNIGLQIQDTSFPDGLKLIDIIKFYCSVFKIKYNSEKIKNLIRFFQLEELLKKWLSKLSGGQKQRVNAMLTMINEPKVLIIDEMASGLDITSKLELVEFINKYVDENNKTYITISHSESEIVETTNRIIILDEGNIVKDTTVKKIGGEKGVYNYFKDKVR